MTTSKVMQRPFRKEFSGARYHVINDQPGHYRQDLFTLHRSCEAFEQTLFETCERFDWKIHAYVLMSNPTTSMWKPLRAIQAGDLMVTEGIFEQLQNDYQLTSIPVRTLHSI